MQFVVALYIPKVLRSVVLLRFDYIVGLSKKKLISI